MNQSAMPQSAAVRRKGGGFTLIEVVIVMAIIAILSAVAFPSYTAYVARGKRADARGQLTQAAQFMQRFYAANDRYDVDRAGGTVTNAMPANLKRSPGDSESPQYDLTITATSVAYTLTMAPASGRSMANDPCGSFTLTSTGVRGVTGTSKTRDECWK